MSNYFNYKRLDYTEASEDDYANYGLFALVVIILYDHLLLQRQHAKQLKLEFPKIVIVVTDENPSCAEEINNRFCFNAPIPFLLREFECTDEISDL